MSRTFIVKFENSNKENKQIAVIFTLILLDQKILAEYPNLKN
jgi:hypothetical protein